MNSADGHDIRSDIFGSISDRQVSARFVADADGVLAEIDQAVQLAGQLRIEVCSALPAGTAVRRGDTLLSVRGAPMQVALGEDRLIGCIAKPSGIATAARLFVDAAAGRLTVVSGAWKKMPMVLKDPIRRAVAVGGAEVRISRTPFIYLDKNYVRMFGGLQQTLSAVRAVESLRPLRRVIQVCGDTLPLADEAVLAAREGADVIFVDSGRVTDLIEAGNALRRAGLRGHAELAFGGGVTLAMLDDLQQCDVDLVDVGRPIIDAPLLDMHMVAEPAR